MVHYSNIQIKKCEASPYIRPQSIFYEENGVAKRWDMVKVHDSVAVLIYHTQEENYIVVKQFRPAVWAHATLCGEEVDGYVYELCAGLVDKPGKSVKEIACEEVLEECGFAISSEMLKPIGVFHSATGISGSKQSVFFVCVNQRQQRHLGGGIEEECIELVRIPRQEVDAFLSDFSIPKSTGLGYALMWSRGKHV
ncbi:NUDIX hydrolase [Helicobacter cynogastricus]|uniref:NUDIX hydrolase n=1 Tax=Helicobacter cynogastricus TaxID=329937 RepID=UPI000CF13BB8|nr:NUDIX hydrolase [Helicobacter cynogastricus]